MPSLLSIGFPTTLNQNEVYATPGRATRGYTDVAALEGNMVSTGGTWAAITITAREFNTVAPFIRCTTGAANVRLL